MVHQFSYSDIISLFATKKVKKLQDTGEII